MPSHLPSHLPAGLPLRLQQRLKVCAPLLMLALLISGCARTGDLGRDRPNLLTGTIMPAIGYSSTYSAGEPVSHFDLTDDERALRNVAWSIVRPNHAWDWLGEGHAQLQRAQIARRMDLRQSPEHYSMLLNLERYRSSDARYARIMDDAAKDMASIAPFMAYAQAVTAADEQRLQASLGLPDITVTEMGAAHGRIAENERQIAWVKRALLFRLYAYRYAVDRLMIRTPSPLAQDTIYLLDAMEAMIEEALAVPLHVAPIQSPQQMVDLMEIVRKA